MNVPRSTETPPLTGRLGLNPWLQRFLTIIAGAAVAVIVWAVIQRFLHIIALLIASFLVAYLLSPVVDRIERGGVKRPLAILVVYVGIFSTIILGFVLLLGPLTQQLQGLITTLPSLISARHGQQTGLDRFFQQHGLRLSVAGLRNQLAAYVSSAGTTLLGSTLSVVTGIVTVVTDLLLALAITFYLLLDGRAMHNRGVRLLPTSYRERWFFVEATIDKVLGGYVRGQLIVAVTVGAAAGVGCWLMGVHDQLVIGLLACLFELIPMIGPVLGMVPAVLIALFQSPGLAMWTVVFFIVLQQIESNVIVPRVSGHAVGLHPLAALLALLVGVELGGLGGALLSVPIAGVIWVLAMAFYSDATGQSHVLVSRPRRAPYTTLTRRVPWRRDKAATSTGDPTSGPMPVHNERLATIKHEQEHLMEQFEAEQVEQADAERRTGSTVTPHANDERAPNDVQARDTL